MELQKKPIPADEAARLYESLRVAEKEIQNTKVDKEREIGVLEEKIITQQREFEEQLNKNELSQPAETDNPQAKTPEVENTLSEALDELQSYANDESSPDNKTKGLRQVNLNNITESIILEETALFKNYFNLLKDTKKISLDKDNKSILYKESIDTNNQINEALSNFTKQFKANPKNLLTLWNQKPPILIWYILYQIGCTEYQFLRVQEIVKKLTNPFGKVSINNLADLITTMISLDLVTLENYDQLNLNPELGRNLYQTINNTTYRHFFDNNLDPIELKSFSNKDDKWIKILTLAHVEQIKVADFTQLNKWLNANLLVIGRKAAQTLIGNLKDSGLLTLNSTGVYSITKSTIELLQDIPP